MFFVTELLNIEVWKRNFINRKRQNNFWTDPFQEFELESIRKDKGGTRPSLA